MKMLSGPPGRRPPPHCETWELVLNLVRGPRGADGGDELAHRAVGAPTSWDPLRRLAELEVSMLAVMHGPAFTGDCHAAYDLADDFDRRVAIARDR